jgi:hypothetical protein
MDVSVPFCEECGVVGVTLSGLHPEDGGVVRWVIYRCGHVKTEIMPDEVPDRVPHLVDLTPSDGRVASSGT